jgi:hypothetical protein
MIFEVWSTAGHCHHCAACHGDKEKRNCERSSKDVVVTKQEIWTKVSRKNRYF